MDLIGLLFRIVLVEPITNVLVAISNVFGGNFGIAIILFTIGMRFATWPLTSSQYKQSRAMQAIQPKVAELQKRYKGKDKQKLNQEMMALYKEHGVNPLGCIFPMLVQMPIWIALYQVIRGSLGGTPESLITLSNRLYPIPYLHSAVPLNTSFLIWNLGQPDTLYILPILVAVTMYVQQKMISPTPQAQSGPMTQQQLQAQQTQQMMTWMMPLMFGWFTLSVPSGLGLYWFVSNLTGVITQYFYAGRRVDWAGMLRFGPPAPTPAVKSRGPVALEPVKAPKHTPGEYTSEEEAAQAGTEDVEEDTASVAQRAAGRDARRKRHGRRRGKR